MDAPAVRRVAAARVDIPNRLKAWRKHFDLTFEQVAYPARLSRQAVQQIEARKGRTTIDTLQDIVTKGLKLSLAEFFASGPPESGQAVIPGTVQP